MRKLTGAVFVSIDVVMQAPGGPEEDLTGGFPIGRLGRTTSVGDSVFAARWREIAKSHSQWLSRRAADTLPIGWINQERRGFRDLCGRAAGITSNPTWRK
jgi:hypothetical protein